MPSITVFKNVKAVLFDLDGTLIDSAPDLGAAADKMRTDRGLPSLPAQRYRPMAGAGARGLLAEAFGITPDDTDFVQMREEFFQNYATRLTQNTTVFTGVPELIARLQAHQLPWGVVTNKIARFTTPLVQSLPLFQTAGTVVSGDTTAYAKPHPAPLLYAAQQLGVQACDCIYVGDDARDIVAGLAAGMGTVAATYGYLSNQADAQQWGAHAVVNSPQGLLQYLNLA